jgi:hypothetical protein
MMRTGLRLAVFAIITALCLGGAGLAADGPAQRLHKKAAKKADPPPPLPAGPKGPIRDQLPLSEMPAVAPEVTYEDGQLTIVALNSTLADILRAVRKQTGAEMDIPANANDRVVTRLGPGPAREVLAELLNGSHFNYVLLGSPKDANQLTRVVLVANTTPAVTSANPQAPSPTIGSVPVNAPPAVAEEPPVEAEDNADDTTEQNAAEAAQPTPGSPEQPGVKTPQQLLQEMQQRQLQLQQQAGQATPPGTPPPPNMPQRPQSEQQ